ncbi:MAG: molybdopterin-synthase adenylyltransferase MoeB [Betaproteobacteria bacterium]|nr:molybdopterin-synthase adenylyltransferase MoeB [Betaproteobacteria bacterium]
MNDQQLLRYSRHLLLTEFGIEAQEALLGSHALIVGAGGLGSPAAMYLASAGVGTLSLADGDTVDLTNLQRQILHGTESVGQAKVVSGRAALARINPDIHVLPLEMRLEGEALDRAVARADVVLDCSDNFATRHAINRACARHEKPLVSGAAVRFDGQLAVFDMRGADSPCYACLFPEDAEHEETRCAVMGVFAPLVGIIGTMQAAEALKVLTGVGDTLSGRLLILDALAMNIRTIRLSRDMDCPVCRIRPDNSKD